MAGAAEADVASDLPGKVLLRNFQRRKELGLLPGHPPLLEAMSAERRAKLQQHETFGYTVSGLATSADQEAPVPATDSTVAELEARRDALQAQLAELEEILAAEKAKSGEVGEGIQTMQEAMGNAVDEHGSLSRELAEAKARAAELEREKQRLQAALKARGGSEKAEEAEAPAPALKPPPEPAASERSAEVLAEKLSLHRAYLLQLDAETAELRRRCAEQGIDPEER